MIGGERERGEEGGRKEEGRRDTRDTANVITDSTKVNDGVREGGGGKRGEEGGEE